MTLHTVQPSVLAKGHLNGNLPCCFCPIAAFEFLYKFGGIFMYFIYKIWFAIYIPWKCQTFVSVDGWWNWLLSSRQETRENRLICNIAFNSLLCALAKAEQWELALWVLFNESPAKPDVAWQHSEIIFLSLLILSLTDSNHPPNNWEVFRSSVECGSPPVRGPDKFQPRRTWQTLQVSKVISYSTGIDACGKTAWQHGLVLLKDAENQQLRLQLGWTKWQRVLTCRSCRQHGHRAEMGWTSIEYPPNFYVCKRYTLVFGPVMSCLVS